MDIRYKQIEKWDNSDSKHYRDPNYEHYRIQRMLEDHEKWSMKVFWGIVSFWAILAVLAFTWLYTYVYTPVSQLWS
jgi:hypothetical protein